MPGRPPIDVFWLEKIRAIKANEPRLGPDPIRKRLEDEAKKLGRSDWPSVRSVAREIARFKAEGDPRPYEVVSWPDSFGEGRLLPWEAADAALEMVAYATGYEYETPLVKAAQWFWRLRQAAPEMPVDDCYMAAWMMAGWEAGDSSIDPRRVETYLVWQPWRNDDIRDLYEAADIPRFPRYVRPKSIERRARALMRTQSTVQGGDVREIEGNSDGS